jgi:hypothetical protein
LQTIYALADRLHKTIDEIMAMNVDEFHGWLAYAKLERERNGK